MIVPGKHVIFMSIIMVAMIVLCELALRQQASNEVIVRLLWCLANHKMNCSPSLLTAHVSNLFTMYSHVMHHMIQVKVQVLMISQLIMSRKHSTLAVEAECLNLLHR